MGRIGLWVIFYSLVVIHLFLVFGVIASFFVLPFYEPWYVAMPLMTFIWFFSTTRVECKLTNAENELRSKLGLKKIGGFVGYYLIRPVKKLKKRKKQDDIQS